MRKEGGPFSRDYWTKPNALRGQDPCTTLIDGKYFLPQSARNNTLITVRVFDRPEDHVQAKPQVLWVPGEDSDHGREVWAPKLVPSIDEPDKTDLHFSASDGNNLHHRTYAARSRTSDPLGPYDEIGRVYDSENDYWAIDLAPFDCMGQRYAIWSGVEEENQKNLLPQNLYIARMLDSVTLGPRQLLSKPEHGWEQTVQPINEGPGILQANGRLFVAVSVDASWTSAYKLKLLELTKGGDPMNHADWIKHERPAMVGNGVGHPSFTEAGGEYTIWYHRKTRQEPTWLDRIIQHRKISFDQGTGVPILGKTPSADIVTFRKPEPVSVSGYSANVA